MNQKHRETNNFKATKKPVWMKYASIHL